MWRERLDFAPVTSRQVVAWLDGGGITSDAGALLPGETDQALRLTKRFAAGFSDTRSASRLLQCVDRIALGYEDLNHPD